MKRIITVVIGALLLLTSLSIIFKSGGEQMYIEVYDRNLEHIANITNVKYDITRRTFDFDTSTFEGVSDAEIKNELVFVLCSATGETVYSGYLQGLKQKGKHVSFKGGDLKTIFDTELVLDYATELGLAPKKLGQLFQDVTFALNDELTGPIGVDFTIPNPEDYIDWIANYDAQHIIINANTFLKPYLAYYSYYIKTRFDTITKTIKCEITKNTDTEEIKLQDFVHETTRSTSTINKATAIMKFDNVDTSKKMWIESSEDYWNRAAQKGSSIQMFPEPLEEAENYEFGYALRIDYQEQGFPETYPIYYQVTNAATARPADLPKKTYYLGNDNLIYEGAIPADKMISPIKAKVFEDGFFQKAQFNAISELVNSRYNDNIFITNTRTPVDLSGIKLYTMIIVYDQNGTSVEMPVSEIQKNNEGLTIKLGFRKTLFTEIMKTENAEAIKSKNSGGSGGTTIITEEGLIYSTTEPTEAKEGTLWLKPEEEIIIDDEEE